MKFLCRVDVDPIRKGYSGGNEENDKISDYRFKAVHNTDDNYIPKQAFTLAVLRGGDWINLFHESVTYSLELLMLTSYVRLFCKG